MSNKIAQRQVVAEIQAERVGNTNPPPFLGYFAQVSGGEITASVEKVYDGGAAFPEVLCAPPEIGDITLTRHYDRARGDHQSLQLVRPLVGRAYYNVTVKDLDCDLAVLGSERIYAKALLVGVSEPEGDSSSGAPATFSLTFSISQVSDKTN
jgi:hypothetical protein